MVWKDLEYLKVCMIREFGKKNNYLEGYDEIYERFFSFI